MNAVQLIISSEMAENEWISNFERHHRPTDVFKKQFGHTVENLRTSTYFYISSLYACIWKNVQHVPTTISKTAKNTLPTQLKLNAKMPIWGYLHDRPQIFLWHSISCLQAQLLFVHLTRIWNLSQLQFFHHCKFALKKNLNVFFAVQIILTVKRHTNNMNHEIDLMLVWFVWRVKFMMKL